MSATHARRVARVAAAGLTVLALATALGAAAAPRGATRAAAEPIEGTWTYEGPVEDLVGMRVEISATGSGFVGTIVRAPDYASTCRQAGRQPWRISGSGLKYTGIHTSWGSYPACSSPLEWDGTWEIRASGAVYELSFCFEGFSGRTCWPFERPKPAAAADTQPPQVKALPSAGAPGRKVKLRFTANDDSGKTREQITIYGDSTQVARSKSSLSAAVAGRVYSIGWNAPRPASGSWRFCVQAWDGAGNASAVSCAPLTLTGGEADEVPCSGPGNVIAGTPDNDNLTGTNGQDTICGGGGNDVIRGMGGNDRIYGGAGSDKLYGDGGNDTLDGHTGDVRGDRDYVSGGDGDDRATVTATADTAAFDLEEVTVCGQIAAGAGPPDCRTTRYG